MAMAKRQRGFIARKRRSHGLQPALRITRRGKQCARHRRLISDEQRQAQAVTPVLLVLLVRYAVHDVALFCSGV